ncbi:MAG: hypothetical protein AAFY60_17000, partial [Myxococcota bacterium]
FRDNTLAGLSIAPEHVVNVGAETNPVGDNGTDAIEVRGGSTNAGGTVQALPFQLSASVTLLHPWTILGGAEFVFETGTFIDVANPGQIIANGAENNRITMRGSSPVAGHHRGIRIATPGNSLRFVDIRDGGGAALFSVLPANVAVDSAGELVLQDCNVSNSGAWGVSVEAGSEFDALGANVFTANTTAGLGISAEFMGRVSGEGQYAGGNGVEGVVVASGTFSAAGTLSRLDAPYVLGSVIGVSAPMTIEAGAEIRFDSVAGMDVFGSGSISAIGTSEAPIRMLGSTESAGFHRGIRIASASPVSVFEFVEIAHGGQSAQFSVQAANIAVDSSGALEIRNSTVRDCTGWGIYTEATITNENNVFSNNTLGDVGP